MERHYEPLYVKCSNVRAGRRTNYGHRSQGGQMPAVLLVSLDRAKGSKRLQRGEAADPPKGKFVFGDFDLKDAAFISIREARGRGGGLPEIRKVTLREAKDLPDYKNLITSLINQFYAILKILFA